MPLIQVAIDGPAASGKSTVAKRVAAQLGGYYVNTGELYRSVTWAALSRNIDPRTDPGGVVKMLGGIDLRCRATGPGSLQIMLDGKAVPVAQMRTPAVARQVSYVARIPEVRTWLKERQRETRELGTIVMEGRDIGTVILTDAPHKFFLTASPVERARRRLAQNNEVSANATIASVAAEIAERDHLDSTRAVAPLKSAADAIHINTDELTVDQVVDQVLAAIRRKT